MTVALIILALSPPSVAFFTFRYLAQRDAADYIERAELMRRIQAPEIAVAQDAVTVTSSDPRHLPFDDDDAWHTYTSEQHLNGNS